MQPHDQVLEVWGDLACFSQPPFKVERFSYPVITPSAARGIYDAIYCKPSRDTANAEFRWQVTRIEILPPRNGANCGPESFTYPNYIALRRNEVKDKISVKAAAAWMLGKQEPEPIWADGDRDMLGTDQKGRTQRQTMALKNVRYRLTAQVRPWRRFEDRVEAFEACFRRRAQNGKCMYQPYFGCREFPAYFEWVGPEAPRPDPLPLDIDLGLMLYDVFDLSRPGSSEDEPCISLFRAVVRGGVLNVPPYESDEVLRGVRRER
jgi:CRISPR-associated protein Cas5d